MNNFTTNQDIKTVIGRYLDTKTKKKKIQLKL